MSSHQYVRKDKENYWECIFCEFKTIARDPEVIGTWAFCKNPDAHHITYHTYHDMVTNTYHAATCNGPKDPHDMCRVHNPEAPSDPH